MDRIRIGGSEKDRVGKRDKGTEIRDEGRRNEDGDREKEDRIEEGRTLRSRRG